MNVDPKLQQQVERLPDTQMFAGLQVSWRGFVQTVAGERRRELAPTYKAGCYQPLFTADPLT